MRIPQTIEVPDPSQARYRYSFGFMVGDRGVFLRRDGDGIQSVVSGIYNGENATFGAVFQPDEAVKMANAILQLVAEIRDGD